MQCPRTGLLVLCALAYGVLPYPAQRAILADMAKQQPAELQQARQDAEAIRRKIHAIEAAGAEILTALAAQPRPGDAPVHVLYARLLRALEGHARDKLLQASEGLRRKGPRASAGDPTEREAVRQRVIAEALRVKVEHPNKSHRKRCKIVMQRLAASDPPLCRSLRAIQMDTRHLEAPASARRTPKTPAATFGPEIKASPDLVVNVGRVAGLKK